MPEETHLLTEESELYPPLLREIDHPPKQLYVRGDIQLLHHPHLLAVVGSRKPSAYGKQAAVRVLTPVVAAGVPLVSGLAYGIDALAHKLCVEAHQPTIAVLGSGNDDASIYPRSHITLAHQILMNGGALVSEYEPGTAGFKHHFPARNRIIAGLSLATLIVQATAKSGSLITARLALEANRDVLAIPGPITDPLSEGTNQLIKDGANPVTEAADILALYNLVTSSQDTPAPHLSPDQQLLLSLLPQQPTHIDMITTLTKLPSEKVATLLLELELLDQVQHFGGMKYSKKA